MSDAERKVYYGRSVKQYAEYRTKYQEWVDIVHPSVIEKINSLKRQTGRTAINNVRSNGINKPLNPFNQFIHEFRTKYVEEHGKISGGEVFRTFVKLGSEAWENLSEAERDVYRERYQKEKAEYLAKLGKLNLKTAKTQEPSTPYLMFKKKFEKYIKEHGEISRKVMSPTFAQLAKDAWNKLPAAKKNSCKKCYEKEKAEYLAEIDKLN